MKASVIIPAHNEENYIAKAIQAALAQDFPDFEIIVVNNASTDRTAEIVTRFPVKLVTETNKGTQWTRERGRLKARGELLAYLDADCLPGKDWLARGTSHFANSRVVAVSGPYDYFDGPTVWRYLTILFQKLFYPPINALMQYFGWGAIMIGGNSFFRASTLAQIGGHDTGLTFWGDDTDSAKRIAKIGKVVWSNTLMMKTSSRRLRSQGAWQTLFLYLFYFLKVSLQNEPTKK